MIPDTMLDTLKKEFFGAIVTEPIPFSYMITYATPSYQLAYNVSRQALHSAYTDGSFDRFIQHIKEHIDHGFNKRIFEQELKRHAQQYVSIAPSIEKGKEIILCNPADYQRLVEMHGIHGMTAYNINIPIKKTDFEELIELLNED